MILAIPVLARIRCKGETVSPLSAFARDPMRIPAGSLLPGR
jgi:hypothetical protein